MRARIRKMFQAIAEDASKKIKDVKCSEVDRLAGVRLVDDFLCEIEAQILMNMDLDSLSESDDESE